MECSTVPTWLRRLFVSHVHDGAAEATLRCDWGYALCLWGQGQGGQRWGLTNQANWTACRDDMFGCGQERVCVRSGHYSDSNAIRQWSFLQQQKSSLNAKEKLRRSWTTLESMWCVKTMQHSYLCYHWLPVCLHQRWKCRTRSRTSSSLCWECCSCPSTCVEGESGEYWMLSWMISCICDITTWQNSAIWWQFWSCELWAVQSQEGSKRSRCCDEQDRLSESRDAQCCRPLNSLGRN